MVLGALCKTALTEGVFSRYKILLFPSSAALIFYFELLVLVISTYKAARGKSGRLA